MTNPLIILQDVVAMKAGEQCFINHCMIWYKVDGLNQGRLSHAQPQHDILILDDTIRQGYDLLSMLHITPDTQFCERLYSKAFWR